MQTPPGWSTHSYEVLVDESHLDFLGHMNNIAYLNLFEKARWEMITERGYGLKVVQKLKQGPVILRIDIQFKKEILLRQKIRIETRMLSYEGRVAQIQQLMVSESGDVHCEAQFSIGLFDIAARKLIPPTLEWLKACGKLEE